MNTRDAASRRRPLKTRGIGPVRALARCIAATAVTPNQISGASLAAALAAAVCLAASSAADGPWRAAMLIAAAVLIQIRLLCNLLDGMVAVEGGKAAPDGHFWNEVPDRISDMVMLAGAGWGAGLPALGWAAAAMAVLTAYLREFGAAHGMAPDFRGPMAKPQRMALLSLAAVAASVNPEGHLAQQVLTGALWVIVIGSALTCLRRASRLLRDARQPQDRWSGHD